MKVYVFWSGPDTEGYMARNDFDDVPAAEEFIAAKLMESDHPSPASFTAIIGAKLAVTADGCRVRLRPQYEPHQ